MGGARVHIVSLGVQNFEKAINSRKPGREGFERAVQRYVQVSLGGVFREFQPADNDKHWRIFVRSFFQHYPEFLGCTFEVIDARNVNGMEKF